MSTGGQFYRKKYKPPTIQYIEEHFQQFFEFMEKISSEYVEFVTNISPEYVEFVKNMTANYVTYMTEMSSKVAVYLEQTVPIIMNREQTLTTVAADANFIASNSVDGIPVGLIDAEFDNAVKLFLLIIGRAVNTFAGQNNLNCAVATDNLWQFNMDGGVFRDLSNVVTAGAKNDGQMLDTDWECMLQGAIHPFTLMCDLTGAFAALGNGVLDNRIGLRLRNARSRQNNLIVTIDVYMKVVWKL